MSAEAKEESVRIQNAADLFSVLATGSLGARLAVLQSIVKDPEKPIVLGSYNGEDFVDLLIRLIPLNSGSLKQIQLLCLMCYQDPRSTEFMVEEFGRSRDAASVLHLAKRLAIEKGSEFFRPFLWHHRSEQALAAARYCSELDNLETGERLRIAILLDQEFEPPYISEQNLKIWLGELQGRHRLKVRRLAESQGQESLHFWDCYSDLPPSEQDWLVLLTAKLNPSYLKRRLPGLLKQPNVSFAVVEQALNQGLTLPVTLLDSDNEHVRAAAVSVGQADDQLESYLTQNRSMIEAVAATSRCTVSQLLKLLGDPRWQVRATATEMISSAPEPPLDELRLKASSELLGERVAALKILEQLGDEEWLRKNIGDLAKRWKEGA